MFVCVCVCILRSSRFLHFFSSSTFLFFPPERLGILVPTLALPFSNVMPHQYLALEHRMHEKFG